MEQKIIYAKHPTRDVFLTTNFDRIHREMSLRRLFQIPLPNSEYAIDNVLVVCVVYLENTLFLSCFDKEEKCLLKKGNGKTFARGKRYVDISCQIF